MFRNFAALLMSAAALLSAADSLSEAAAKRGIRIGAAVQSGYIAGEPAYAATLSREYSMIEPEYEMLWNTIHPSPASYNFSGADKLVDYAGKNGVPLRADHLVWHSSLPSWLNSLTSDQLKQALRDHIMTVAGRYAGKVYSWEVVNEAVADGGGHQLPHIEYPGLPREEMMAAVNRFYDSYYFRPRVVWRIVRDSLWDAHERKRLYTEAVEYLRVRSERSKYARKKVANA